MSRTPVSTASLRAVGYVARRREVLAVTAALVAPAGHGARALLLTGPPGCGKSALADAVTQVTGAHLVAYQCHAWTDADDLFVGVDVAAAVAGDSAAVRQPGVLLRVAELAEVGPVVLLIDEIDKTSERAEALLLDWLQTGRVPVRPGEQVMTDLSRVLVILTSNGQRTLGDALMRRLRRVAMEPLPLAVTERLLHERSGAPMGIVRLTWRAARMVAEAEGNYALSPQEGIRLLAELTLCEDINDVRESLAGWAARTVAGRVEAMSLGLASAVWSEVKRNRETT